MLTRLTVPTWRGSRGESPALNAAEARDLVSRRLDGDAAVAAADLDQYQGATGMALLHVEQALEDAELS